MWTEKTLALFLYIDRCLLLPVVASNAAPEGVSLLSVRVSWSHIVFLLLPPPQPLSMSSCLTHTGSTVWSCRSRLIFSCLSSVVDAFIRLVSCLVRTQVEPFEV